MKQQEIRRNKGKKTKKFRKKKPKIQEKQPRFCGCLLGPCLTIKLGILRFLHFVGPPSEFTAIFLCALQGTRAKRPLKILRVVLRARSHLCNAPLFLGGSFCRAAEAYA